MEVQNTKDQPRVASMMMMVYGEGGVGKTTFAASFPKPLLLDFENGSKYFGERGIELDVAVFKDWLTAEDKKQLHGMIPNYETIIVDPIGEAMEKLIDGKTIIGSKNRQGDGSLTAAGWGLAKKEMRNFIKYLRDTGKNIVLVAHVAEFMDDEQLVKRPMIATKLSAELVNMVDAVGFMQIISVNGEEKRVLAMDASNAKYISKDRTGKLGKYVSPDYNYIHGLLNADAPKTPATPAATEAAPAPAETATPAAEDKPAPKLTKKQQLIAEAQERELDAEQDLEAMTIAQLEDAIEQFDADNSKK